MGYTSLCPQRGRRDKSRLHFLIVLICSALERFKFLIYTLRVRAVVPPCAPVVGRENRLKLGFY